jgi:hypothetical protein
MKCLNVSSCELYLHSLQFIQREVTNLNRQRESDRGTQAGQVQILNQNVRRLFVNSIRWPNQQQIQNEADPVAPPESGPPADLSWTPCTVYELWEEYQNRTGGRKAAREFSPQDRGRVKRNIVVGTLCGMSPLLPVFVLEILHKLSASESTRLMERQRL